MQTTPAASEPGRIQTNAAAGLVVLAIIGAMVTVIYRGPEFDEFWTLTISDPATPFGEQFANTWMRDAHPPLFAFGARLAQSIVGDSYVALRFFNLVPLFAFLGVFGACWAWAPRARAFLLSFLLLWVSSMFFGWYFAVGRSYFAQHAFVAAFLVGSVVSLLHPPEPKRQRELLAIFTMAGLFFAANLYFLTAAIAGPFLALFFLMALLQRRNRLALAFFIGGVIAYVPLIVTTLIQAEFMLRYASNDNWVKWQKLDSAFREFMRAMWKSAGQNVPAVLLAIGCALAGIVALVRKPGAIGRIGQHSRLALAMFAVWIAVSALLLAIDQVKPFIVGQYLLALGAALNTVIALTIAQPAFRWPALYWLSFVCAAVITAASVVQKSQELNWFNTIRVVEAAVKTCDAPVLAATWPREKRPELELAIFPLAYRHAAKAGGFEANLHPYEGQPLLSNPSACGEYVWVEHMPSDMVRDLPVDQILQTIGASPPAGAKVDVLTRADSGVVLHVLPAETP